LFHDYFSPRTINPGLRILPQYLRDVVLCLCVFTSSSGYIEQREALAKTVQQQRDDLLQDVKLAAQVQRLFLPSGKPAIDGLEIAG